VGNVRYWILVLAFPLLYARGDVVDDLLSLGVPAVSAFAGDSTLAVEIEGSLAQGDSLLKHYGGIFFLLADSIGAGWDVVGLRVYISGAVLVFDRSDMYTALGQIRNGTPDSAVALWILEHTLVYNRSVSPSDTAPAE
jgi:hypothetical protein